ncbi:MAG TPA: TraB/GumN family protein [Caulobacteraceae bacterium]|nr:TraB/GumN family protein [Caulobacteraceae bacterium]
MRPVRLALVAALAVLAPACGARAEPAMWTVADADGRITLYGTVHVLKPGTQWRSDRLERRLGEARELWTELPEEPGWDGAVAAETALRGTLPAGRTLNAFLSEDGRARLDRIMERLTLAPGSLDRLEPWLAEVVLTVAWYGRAGATQGHGVETVLNDLAPPQAARRAFETASEQIAVFDEAPVEDQVASLEYALRQIEEDPAGFDRLVDAWVEGDVCRLEREALRPLKRVSPVLYDRLIVQRNRRWAERIEAMLKEGSGEVFVAVGAGHLIGADGVPALLRARGLKVKGPTGRFCALDPRRFGRVQPPG